MIALLVIDVQNAYFEDPALAAQQDTLVAACNELLDAFASNGHKALLVGAEHERDKSTWSLNMLDDDQGFIFRGSDQGQCAYGYGSAVAAAELGRGRSGAGRRFRVQLHRPDRFGRLRPERPRHLCRGRLLPQGPLRSVSGTASGRSQRLATLTDCPSAADSSTDSITSSSWKAS